MEYVFQGYLVNCPNCPKCIISLRGGCDLQGEPPAGFAKPAPVGESQCRVAWCIS